MSEFDRNKAYKMRPGVATEAFENLPTFEEAREFVGGHIEIVNLRGGSQMLVNEDGYQLALPYNSMASAVYGGVIVGNAIYGTRAIIGRICS